jgi:PDZ domain-containing protein
MASSKKRVSYIVFVILAALIIISIFYRLPYYVMEPGDTHNLDPVIDIEGGHEYKHGQFLFMTVKVIQPNIWQYELAKFLKYRTIYKLDDLRLKGENQQEYNERQLYYMDSSQIAATYVAYKKAGKNPKIEHNGVIVESLIDGMPAEKKLKLGDVIVGADGKKVETQQDLLNASKEKKKGDSIKLTVKRNGKRITVTVPFGRFPDRLLKNDQNPKKYGMGITQAPNLSLNVHPPVKFHTEQIGGPSGGLMFTLGIYNRLTEENWTKGYKIAGTGTMNIKQTPGSDKVTGVVGPIGGIKDKVVAADNDNVEIFFAPTADHNYKDAVETAKDIGTDMKIVPVKTFQDALDYLKKLPPKKGSNEEKSKAA